jgi:phosphoribosylglycinamide formyltransferase 2
VEDALLEPGTDIRIFGKPVARTYRRMGVALASGEPGSDVDAVKHKAIANAAKVKVVSEEAL